MKQQLANYGDDFVKKLEELGKRKPAKTFDTHEISGRLAHMANSGGGLSARDFERYIGDNDLVRINYFERGLLAARAVCRIFVPEEFGSDASWGTGFLISPNLLLTNNHVLATVADAGSSFAEFGYEADINGILKQGKRFRLRPDLAFVTSPKEKLDFTVVAIETVSDDGATPLSTYGFIRLIPQLRKIDESEFVTIIQHPNGEEKFVAVRENKVVKIGDELDKEKDNFLWYVSDTAPGSSGAPAFNDNWQVVAIHHKGVPVTRIKNGVEEVQRTNGDWVTRAEAERNDKFELKYVANEGVRISKIVADIVSQYQAGNKFALIKALIDDATGVVPFATSNVKASIVSPETEGFSVATGFERAAKRNVHPAEYFDGREGFDKTFLGVHIGLPQVTDEALKFGNKALLINSRESELKYTNFSVVMNADRKLAFFAAVNIDGKKWKNLERGSDKWFFDGRIDLSLQADDDLYGNEPVPRKNWFDRGHLVRRLDPVWGNAETAATANEDTFHWTNCSPQYWGFNQGQEFWQGLENYILYNTDQENIRANVYNGPVFGLDDEWHRGVPIPQYFWKVVVVADGDGTLYSSAFVVSQKKYARNIPFEELPVGNFNNFQTTIEKLERLTGLRFDDAIRNSDVAADATSDYELRSLSDIKIKRRTGKTVEKAVLN